MKDRAQRPLEDQAGASHDESEGARAIRQCRYRAPLLWLLVPFVAGAVLERSHPAAVVPRAPELGAAAALAAMLFAHRARTWGCLLGVAMGLAGFASFNRIDHPPSGSAAPRGPVELDVFIRQISRPRESRRPAHGGNGLILASGLGEIVGGQPGAAGLTGESVSFACVVSPGGDPPAPGTTVRLSGRVRRVSSRGGADSFNGYLRGRGVRFILGPAWMRGVIRPPSRYARAKEALADRMSALLAVGFDARPDLAAIFRAMMLGRKNALTPGQKRLFLRTGTMHLFAINGLHIGIVAVSVHALLALFRVPRGAPGVLATLGVLWIDVDATGGSPSALRAFFMVGLIAGGRSAALPVNPLAALAAAAAALLAIHPAELFSASFQLSFAVVLTLLLLGMPLAHRLRRVLPERIASALGFSLAATAVSAVTGITYFGTLSLVSLPANLLLMPLAALAIVAGFASIVSGLAHLAWLTPLFNAAALLLLRALGAGLERFAALPDAALVAHYRADWIGPAALAAFLALAFRGYARDWAGGLRGFLPPFIAVALTLLLGVRYAP